MFRKLGSSCRSACPGERLAAPWALDGQAAPWGQPMLYLEQLSSINETISEMEEAGRRYLEVGTV